MSKDVQYPVVGKVVGIYDLGIVNIFSAIRGDCNCQVVAFKRLDLQAICQIWTIVYMALDDVICFEIEKHVGGK